MTGFVGQLPLSHQLALPRSGPAAVRPVSGQNGGIAAVRLAPAQRSSWHSLNRQSVMKASYLRILHFSRYWHEPIPSTTTAP
jgi:hypothetical protein